MSDTINKQSGSSSPMRRLPHDYRNTPSYATPSSFSSPSNPSSSFTIMSPNGSLTPTRPSTTSKLPSASIVSSSSSSKSTISYESFAPRSLEQRSRLTRIQQLTCGPIGNPNLSLNTENANPIQENNSNTSTNHETESNANTNSNSENDHSDIMTTSNNNDKLSHPNPTINQSLIISRNKAHHLTNLLTHTHTLQTTLSQTISLATTLSNKHSTLLQQSSELSLAAERLQHQVDMLTSHASDIGLPLKQYDAVDQLGISLGVLFQLSKSGGIGERRRVGNGGSVKSNFVVVKGMARIQVDHIVEFEMLLEQIDEALDFFHERVESISSDSNLDNNTNTTASSKSSSRSSATNTAISGSTEYYTRALILQEAALEMLHDAIVNRIQQTTSQILSALDLKRKTVSGDQLEASLIYTRFHGISSRTCQLLQMIKHRLDVSKQKRLGTNGEGMDLNGKTNGNTSYSRSEMTNGSKNSTSHSKSEKSKTCPYDELWNECRRVYISSRDSLLRLSIRNHLDALKDKHGLVGMTRLASVFLCRFCTIETSLYLDFFGSKPKPATTSNDSNNNTNNDGNNNSSEDIENETKKNAQTNSIASQLLSPNGTYYDTDFQSYLDSLCSNLHRTIRRGLVSIMDLDTLCQIVSVLREERNIANVSPTTMAAARAISKVIVDTQERLIFCANTTLSREVVMFKPTPLDLDYPDKLRRIKNVSDGDSTTTTTTTGVTIQTSETASLLSNTATNAEEEALQSHMQVYESWFPPIKNVLKILSKIFRVVEPKVFEDIALTGVQACVRSLKDGSVHVERKSGVLHAHLFLVKHLLILREQLSPFDIQLRSIERQLDFSDAGKAVSRFLANQNRRLFSMSNENALVTLLCEGLSTREASIDSKRDLEDALRSACNNFIEHTTLSLAGPILTFVEQCKSADASDSSLMEQSFMTVEYVKAVVDRAMDRLEPELGEVRTQMGLYMDNVATQNILMKPIIRKITRFTEEAKRFITEGTKNSKDDGWNDSVRNSVFKTIEDFESLLSTPQRVST